MRARFWTLAAGPLLSPGAARKQDGEGSRPRRRHNCTVHLGELPTGRVQRLEHIQGGDLHACKHAGGHTDAQVTHANDYVQSAVCHPRLERPEHHQRRDLHGDSSQASGSLLVLGAIPGVQGPGSNELSCMQQKPNLVQSPGQVAQGMHMRDCMHASGAAHLTAVTQGVL